MNDQPASTEEAVELWLDERRRGIASDPTAFAARFEGLGPELVAALETLHALERAGAAPDDEVLPERIGPFRIVREIGRGGMGLVLEAIEEPLGRRVALKVLPGDALTSAAARARFEREARLAARLDHPGIATVYGAGVAQGRPWIAMRYVDGETLAGHIADARRGARRTARLARGDSPSSIARVLAEVARALEFAHEQGVIHRDVKPSNVILSPDGRPVLVDFGLALAAESDGHSLTRTGDTAGTPAYLAPEIVDGARARPDAQCDVYALGVTLYECLTLRRPFDGPTPAALYHAIATRTPPDVRATNRALPRDLAVVVATALEGDRARRYASAAALAADLEACADGRPIAARPVSLAGRVARWARREPRQALLAGLLACVTLAAAALAGTWFESRSTVRAASRLTTLDRYERALQDGFGFLATNWLPEAERAFAEARALVPGSDEALAGRALALMEQRREAEAAELLAQAPDTPAFDALRSLAQGVVPDVEQPARWVAEAPAVELFVDGMRLMRQLDLAPPSDHGRIAELALARFEGAVERSRSAHFAYHIQRTLAAWRAGDEVAIRSSTSALTILWPDQERALFTAGLALYDVDAHAAVALLERAVALDPGWGAPHQVLGNALRAAGDLDRAQRMLLRAIELDPSDADAFNSLGLVESERGRADEARAAYLAALDLRPMFATWANIGLLDARGDDLDTAERELRAALELEPWQNAVRVPLARLLHRQGRVDEALAELEAAFLVDEQDASARELHALWQAELGLAETAEAAAQRARAPSAPR